MTTGLAHDERAQDLAEALRRVCDAANDAVHSDSGLDDHVDHAERLLASLTYDTASSASSQNYIDTGVRFLVEVEPPRLTVEVVMLPDEDEIGDPDVEEPTLRPALRCPVCHKVNQWQELDRSVRWNDMEVVVQADGSLLLDITQGDCEHETTGFRCTCGAVVDIPADVGVPLTYAWS